MAKLYGRIRAGDLRKGKEHLAPADDEGSLLLQTVCGVEEHIGYLNRLGITNALPQPLEVHEKDDGVCRNCVRQAS